MTDTAAPGLQFSGHILSIDLGVAVRTEGRGTISSREEGKHISKHSADKGQSVPESLAAE